MRDEAPGAVSRASLAGNLTAAAAATLLPIAQNLFFAHARHLEDRVAKAPPARPARQHLVLQSTGATDLDASAFDSLSI